MMVQNTTKRQNSQKLQELKEGISDILQKNDELSLRNLELRDRQLDLIKSNGGSHAKGSDKLCLNVGGTEVYALRETLTLVKGSNLEALFSGRWENKLPRDKKGRVFLDMDVYYFKKIIEYMSSIKANIKAEDGSQRGPSSWPTCADKDKQKKFDQYVGFFGLRKTGDKTNTYRSTIEDSNNSSIKELTDSCADLLNVFEKEGKELDGLVKELDEMEKKLAEEEDFVTSLIKPNNIAQVNNKPETGYEIDYTCSSVVTSDDLVSATTWSSFTNQQTEGNTKNLILNFWIDGKIISVKRSALIGCNDLDIGAEKFNDTAWLENRSFKNKDGLEVILMKHSSVSKSIINLLSLQDRKISGDNKFAHEVGEKNALDSSLILTSHSEGNQVLSWIEEVKRDCQPNLLYRASRDGWEVKSFRSKCIYKNNTIVLVKTSKGYVFGGYSDQTWQSKYKIGETKSSTNCFLFSLKCHAGLPPTKMKLKNGQGDAAVFCYCGTDKHGFGPCFGSAHDMAIGNKNNTMRDGYTLLNNSYQIPLGTTNAFLTGAKRNERFDIVEVEVFEV